MSNKITISRRRLLCVYGRQASYLICNRYDRQAGDNQEAFLQELEKCREQINKFDYLSFHKGNIPLLLVVSRQLLELRLQMKNLRIGGNPGICKIADCEKFEDPTNKRLIYPIFNVNCGDDSYPCKANEARTALNINGRAGLLIEEGIALTRYYGHLSLRTPLYLVGAIQDKPPRVPILIYLSRLSSVSLTVSKGFRDQAYRIPSRDRMFDP